MGVTLRSVSSQQTSVEQASGAALAGPPDVLVCAAYLAIGTTLSVFSYGRWMIALAAWLAPVFLLRFARSQPAPIGLLGVWFGLTVATIIADHGVIPVDGILYPLVVMVLVGLIQMPAFLSDRLLAPALPGVAATLVFPAAWVVGEFVNARLNPMGDWGSLGFTQYGNLPLMQLASVTGVSGISFLVAWFASTINWAWERGFDPSSCWPALALFAAVFTLVLLMGGARLTFTQNLGPTVRIAGIAPARSPTEVAGYLSDDPIVRVNVREDQLEMADRFFAETERQAIAGATLVTWHETSVSIPRHDEAALIQHAQEIAIRHRIFLLVSYGALDMERFGQRESFQNKALLIDPEGKVVIDYLKVKPLPGFEAQVTQRGDGRIPIYGAAIGRLAAVVCSDLDHPDFIRQIGQAGADLLIAPSSDWPEIGYLHQQQSVFRAIENGVAIIRPARSGVSSVIDSMGRVLAISNTSQTNDLAIVANVPAAGTATLYALAGDAFAWLCLAGIAVAVATTWIWAGATR